jgi:hypothetical protein
MPSGFEEANKMRISFLEPVEISVFGTVVGGFVLGTDAESHAPAVSASEVEERWKRREWKFALMEAAAY